MIGDDDMIAVLVILSLVILVLLAISGLCQEILHSIEDQQQDTWDSGVYTANGYVNANGINRPIRK